VWQLIYDAQLQTEPVTGAKTRLFLVAAQMPEVVILSINVTHSDREVFRVLLLSTEEPDVCEAQ